MQKQVLIFFFKESEVLIKTGMEHDEKVEHMDESNLKWKET